MVNKKYWLIATLSRKEPCTLQSRISALDIHKISHLVIGDRLYEPGLEEHVFTYANNLTAVPLKLILGLTD